MMEAAHSRAGDKTLDETPRHGEPLPLVPVSSGALKPGGKCSDVRGRKCVFTDDLQQRTEPGVVLITGV